MAERVTDVQLRSYLHLDANDTTDLTLFLSMGNMTVDEYLLGKGLTDNQLFLIELNLDAHYSTLAIEKGGITREKVGQSELQYPIIRTAQPNLSSTRYGMQAVTLDTSGTLGTMDVAKGNAEFSVMTTSDMINPRWPVVGFE